MLLIPGNREAVSLHSSTYQLSTCIANSLWQPLFGWERTRQWHQNSANHDAEEEDGSTDSGCVVANADNNVEVAANAVVAIVVGAVGWHIDLEVAVQKSIY